MPPQEVDYADAYTREINDDAPEQPAFIEGDDGYYEENSQYDRPLGQIDEAQAADFLEEGGRKAAFTILNRGGGKATIRSNVTIKVSVNASLLRNNPVTATLPPGATFTGEDSNNNGIPDKFEDIVRHKWISWSNPF